MNTNTYALSRTEQLWLLFSVTFLLCAVCYGLLVANVLRAITRLDLVVFLQDLPVLFLISLSLGFILTATGHYAIRQTFKTVTEGVPS